MNHKIKYLHNKKLLHYFCKTLTPKSSKSVYQGTGSPTTDNKQLLSKFTKDNTN